MDKIRLELIGITYNQIESGVYAVILQQAGGTRRIPIIIGYSEAQAIECKLQEVRTPRPLTHDLMASILSEFGITLREIVIYRLDSGVFAAELVLSDGSRTHIVDSRSSDAIALAIRVGAPIYTTPKVLTEAGFEPDDSKAPEIGIKATRKVKKSRRPEPEEDDELSFLSRDDLYEEMEKAAGEENYERAAKIKAEIDRLEKAAEENPGDTDLPF